MLGSHTKPGEAAAQPTGVYNRDARPFVAPTMRTVVRNAVTADLVGPTGIV
jgi:hypothetical protein